MSCSSSGQLVYDFCLEEANQRIGKGGSGHGEHYSNGQNGTLLEDGYGTEDHQRSVLVYITDA